MTGSFPLPRRLLIFLIVLPLAAFVGYLLSAPDNFNSIVWMVLIVGVLLIPVFLRWHHPFLIFSWNAAIDLYLLPGKPYLWMVLGFISLFLTVLARILHKETKLVSVPSVSWSLVAFAVVVFVTAELTRGMGLRSMGSGIFGGKKYFYIFFTVVGYFAISAVRVPIAKAGLHSAMFFLSALTVALSSLIYVAGPNFYFLYALFPIDYALGQAYEEFFGVGLFAKFNRMSGLFPAFHAAAGFMLLRYGLKGIFDYTKPWRLGMWLLMVALSMLGGYRSSVVSLLLICGFQFWFERVYRSSGFLALLLFAAVSFCVLIPFAEKLPLSVQRSLSILPLPLNAAVRVDAKASSQWRLDMWRILWPEVPRYLILGKGYSATEADYYLTMESIRRGLAKDYENSMLAGDYHNGPLSVLLPFGMFGA